MELSSSKIQEYGIRLMLSRLRLLNTHGLYGLLLMHMRFAIDVDCETAFTDGTNIYFGLRFLESLSDSEFDFIMMHERFNIACDIVINSNILLTNNMQNRPLPSVGMNSCILHQMVKRGHLYTAEILNRSVHFLKLADAFTDEKENVTIYIAPFIICDITDFAKYFIFNYD